VRINNGRSVQLAGYNAALAARQFERWRRNKGVEQRWGGLMTQANQYNPRASGLPELASQSRRRAAKP
jgi:hypothetical protein